MGDVYTNPPQSRNEAILRATIDGTEYTAPPQSRIEDLLLELKEAIEQGGTGEGDMKKSVYDSDLAVASAGGIKMFVNSKIGTLPQRVGSLETTADVLQGEVVSIENTLGGLGTASTKNSTSVVTDSSDLVESGAVKDIVGWGNKNLADVSKAEIGVAWNGTSNVDRARLIIPCEHNTQYIVSVDGTLVDYIGIATSASIPPSGITKITDDLPYTFTSGANDNYITLGFNKGNISQSNIDALKLMLRKADITNPTYEPYHASVKVTLKNAEVIKGKNLIPLTISAIKSMNNDGTWSGNVYTRRGVTFTIIPYEDDYVARIVVNGTATGGDAILQLPIVDVSDGSYLGSSGIAYSPSSAFIQARVVGGTYEYFSFDINGVAINNKNIDQIYCAVISGNSVSNVSLYPMIREATETDPTYEPYYVPLKDVVPNKCDNSVIGTVEDGATASQAYAVRSHFIRNGAFCTVTTTISSGESLVGSSKFTSGDVADELDVKEITVTAGANISIESAYNKVYKQGNIVFSKIRFTISSAVASNTVICTMPNITSIVDYPRFDIRTKEAPFSIVGTAFVSPNNELIIAHDISNPLQAGIYEVTFSFMCK